MRRLISLLTAVVIAAGPIAAAGGAMAKDHREERREQQAPRGQEARGGPARQQAEPYRGGGQEYRGGQGYRGGGLGGGLERADPRYEPRGEPRSDPRYQPRAYPRNDYPSERYEPRYAQPPAVYQPAPRRGGFLGGQGGQVIEDPGRYRLRAPPRGYDWVRTQGGMALVQQGTGRVYDVVPN
jgi:Ni/Co efflux regulator RcnB